MPTYGFSRRGQQLLARPPFPEYLQEHFERCDVAYDTANRADGYLGLSVAENSLLGDLLVEKLATIREIPASVLGYDTMIGSAAFRQQLARFLGRKVLGRDVAPDNIAVLAGAGSVLEVLFYILAEAGDGVLVPTPSYAGFWADLETRDELRIVPVATDRQDGFRLTPAHLDRAVAAAGRPVKALLFTSPDNPLGTVYSAAEIAEILSWAEQAKIHVVFDEIYALSVYGDRPFTSCARVASQLGDRVHIVWAFSKDFGASGLRCGVLVSENEALIRAVDALAYWACCSGHTQYLLGEMIADEAWVDAYVDRMQGVLREAHGRVCAALAEQGIPHLPSTAGFFLLCDLRQYLAAPTWEAERDLWRRLLDEQNVNLTPGASCHNPEPGFLRLCFASLPTDHVTAGIRRIGATLARLRRSA